ncbi:hypothetical protein DYB25_003536 [Aphanomyces astaci]|uniref:Uncharacterized protein n=1 Tax=Aphanomyces astaci TaxID=112090 RepID=A0A397C3T4_APHAT|nr:hypothetical protein DYB25_003536 [Aphanomyces astaci]
MVRKKRKTTVNYLVKTRGLASSSLPLPVDIRDIDLPTAGSVRLAVSTTPDTAANLELNLEELYGNLVQAPDTYAQLKVLQLFRSHLKLVITAAATIQTLPDSTQTTFWQVAQDSFRFIFRLYLHPSMKAMRKTILPILDSLSLYDATFPALVASTGSSIGDIIVSEVTRFLDVVLAQSSELDATIPLDQILALCEYSTATELLWVLHHTLKSTYLVQLVEYCNDQLRLIAAPIVSYHGQHDVAAGASSTDNDDDDTQPSEVVVASERCLGVLKSVIILCTAADKPSTLRLMDPPVPSESSSQSSLVGSLEHFVTQSLVLLATSAVHKDLVTTVGLATTLLLKVHVLEAKVTANVELTYVQGMSSWLLGDGSRSLPLMPLDTMTNLSALPKLALYRGFLNSITDHSFLHQEPPAPILVEVLFTTVLSHCHSAHLTVRMYAFQVLEMFLRRIVQQPVLVLTTNTVYALLDTILLNWEHPAKKINQFMAPMFTHVVAVLGLDAAFDWPAMLRRLLLQPEQHRSKYIALGILLPKLDAVSLLDQHPTLLHGVLSAVGNQEVAASAASLFVQLLEALRRATSTTTLTPDLTAWSKWWVDAVVDALLNSDTHLRLRIATYVLPILVKSEPASVAILLEAARLRPDSDARLWTLLELVKCARKIMLEPPTLTTDEINFGLTHASGDIRMAAYDMLCTSLKTTSLPSESDIAFVQTFLLSSAKSIATSLRMKLIIGLKATLLRIREGARKTCRRDVTASEHLALQFPAWLEGFVVSCITPSATPQRLTMGLEVFQLYTQIFDNPPSLHTPAITNALLNAMISCWDRVRTLSYSILETFPSPLPGYELGLDTLFDWALTLCCSPRQRESDAGAHFMRLLYKQHVHLTFLPSPRTPQACVAHIVALLGARLDELETVNAPGEPPLIHGLLLATRYMLEDTPSLDHTWHAPVTAIFSVLWRALNTALVVVGDATSGVGTQALDAAYAVVGEVSAIPPLRAKMDCRGHLVLDDPDVADGDSAQRAVVGSWLAAREAAAVLATLVKAALITPSLLETPTTASSVQRAGDVLLNALFELKHGGAVATVSVAYEDICKALLSSSPSFSTSSTDSIRRSLALSPAKWCDVLLHRLEHAEQQFILRRSAGFASSFVAILRAEPRNAAATLLPHVLATLLRLARDVDTVERVRVHALNILKLLGQDAILAEDVAVFVPDLLTVAVHGFESKSWAVRNSSMMLFAAATQRAIGDKQVADGAAAVGVSAQDVFTRCKGLDTFLLTHLQSQVYPLLLFLSRLRPDDVADQHSAATISDVLPLDTFVPLVVACAGETHIFHRRMAAHALAAIVAPTSIPAVVATLVQALQGPRYKNNKLHGSMLQLQALVDKYQPPISKTTLTSTWMDALDADLAAVLPRLLALRCDTNRGVFVHLALQVVAKVTEKSGNKSALWPLLVAHCDAVSHIQPSASPSPGHDLYLQGVASCLVQAALADEKAAASLVRGLTSPVFELRRSTTREFADHLHMLPWQHATFAGIVGAVTAQLVNESHPPTRTKQLVLLSQLLETNSDHVRVMVAVSGAVDRILALAVDSMDPLATGPAVELLGRVTLVQPHVLPSFVERVVELSDENKPLGVRLAAAKSLRGCSGSVLRPHDHMDVTVAAWIATLDLLQDDDVGVRDVIRVAAVESINHQGLTQSSDMLVLPRAIDFLASHPTLAASTVLRDHVQGTLEAWTTVVPWLDECLQDSSHLLLCEKIFEAESGNYFKQPALTVQLYTWYFVRTGVVPAPPSILPQAMAALQQWLKSATVHAWIGGTTFFPDVFPRLHNLLVVAVAVVLVIGQAHPELHGVASALLAHQGNMHPLVHTALTALKDAAADPKAASTDNALASIMYLAPFWSTKLGRNV